MCKLSSKRYIYLVLCLIIITGCSTTSISLIPYKKEHSKYVNNLAILYPAYNPEMSVNIRTGDQLLLSLAAGPAIIPQMIMRIAFEFTKQDDNMVFNDMIFDLNIGEVMCEKLNTKFQLCSNLHVVPQESITENKVVWKLLEKRNKDFKDYQKIGTELGVDTLLEININSYGIKGPGIFSDPYESYDMVAFLEADVKMTTTSGGIILWRDIVEARINIKMETTDVIDASYENAQFLKQELERVVDAVSEECMERLGFDTSYTYLLDKDYYLRNKKNEIDMAKKLDELNVLRYGCLITDVDYDEKKLNLIERARSIKHVYRKNPQNDAGND